MDLGESEQRIIKQAIRAGNPIPDRIANKPDLMIGLDLYLMAYFDLSTERPPSMTISPIPISKMKEYALYWNLEFEQTEDLIYLIRRMDVSNIERIIESQPKK